MRERISLPVSLVRAIERRAREIGEPVDVAAARVMARGAVLLVADLLKPYFVQDAAAPPALAEGATSDSSSQTRAERHVTARRPVKGAGGASAAR